MTLLINSIGRSYPSVASAVNSLRYNGFQPRCDTESGRILDWRKVQDHKVYVAETEVRPSGKVVVTCRVD